MRGNAFCFAVKEKGSGGKRKRKTFAIIVKDERKEMKGLLEDT